MTPQLYAVAAVLVVLLHVLFVAFVVAGAALLWRWPRVAWLHLPAVAWGVFVELAGRVCPLTPLEMRLRLLAGLEGYEGDFIGHWVLPLLYPAGLTQGMQVAFGLGALLINLALYGAWLAGRRRRRGRSGRPRPRQRT